MFVVLLCVLHTLSTLGMGKGCQRFVELHVYAVESRSRKLSATRKKIRASALLDTDKLPIGLYNYSFRLSIMANVPGL